MTSQPILLVLGFDPFPLLASFVHSGRWVICHLVMFRAVLPWLSVLDTESL